MADRRQLAERAFVPAVLHLVMQGLGTENDQLWLNEIRAMLVDCDKCPLAMAQMRSAARVVTEAKTGHDRSLAMARLRLEVQTYLASAAGQRIGEWREATQKQMAREGAL